MMHPMEDQEMEMSPLLAEIQELKKLVLKYEHLLEDVHKACLCERSLEGFDYHEHHKYLGKPNGRWLTPKDLIENRLGFDWIYEKPTGVCNSFKQLKMLKNNAREEKLSGSEA